MFAYPYPTHQSSRGAVPRASLTCAFTLMILLGSLVSPMLPSVTAGTRIDQRAAGPAKQAAQPAGTESATEPATGTATTQTESVDPANAEGMSVTIYKWECVPGTLTGQPLSYYQGEDQCEGEKRGVVFDVTDDNGTRQTTSAKNGRPIDGLVGEVTLTEVLPEDYETPAVFCTSLTGQPGQEITGSGNSVTLTPDAGEDYQCSFYNIPSGVSATGTGDVLVYTYACASTPPPNSTYAWYFQNCTMRQNGATFMLDTPDADIEASTGDSLDGAVMMRGLKVGDYPLAETVMMPDHEVGAVFCAEIGKTELPGPAQMLPQQVSGNSITAPVTADMLFYCHWYHVPAASGDGTLSVRMDSASNSAAPIAMRLPNGTLTSATRQY